MVFVRNLETGVKRRSAISKAVEGKSAETPYMIAMSKSLFKEGRYQVVKEREPVSKPEKWAVGIIKIDGERQTEKDWKQGEDGGYLQPDRCERREEVRIRSSWTATTSRLLGTMEE